MKRRLLIVSGVIVGLCAAAEGQENRPGGGGGGRGGLNPAQFVERLMENDANGDGKLSRDELPGQFADRLFESGDANKDGYLDRAELEAIAARRGQGPGGPPPAAGPGDERSVHDLMEGAGSALRRLRRAVFGQTPTDQVLAHIQTIQAALLAVKGKAAEAPMAPQAKEKYGDDAESFQRDFRLEVLRALRESITLEIAVLEGKADAAGESLTKLIEIQEQAHERFQPPGSDW